jgi:signal peptidase I
MSDKNKHKKGVSKKTDIKEILKKIWYFIWEDDSLLSWFVNIVLAFVIIKFVIYPVLGFFLATSFPIVAVVSGSMEHAYAPATNNMGYDVVLPNGNILYKFCDDTYEKKNSLVNFKDFRDFDTFWNLCGDWYEKRGITYDKFKTFPFTNGFNKGDIMILYGANINDLRVGDIVVFKGKSRTEPIIHRVVDIRIENGEYHLATKGDHNEDSSFAIGENDIAKDQYIAKAVFRLPYFGWIKILFTYVFTGFKPIY